MEDNLELAGSWCQIRYLKKSFLRSLMSLRNGFVLGTNIWISIFKWIENENVKLKNNWAVEQTLQNSLIPLFFWDTLYEFSLRHQQGSSWKSCKAIKWDFPWNNCSNDLKLFCKFQIISRCFLSSFLRVYHIISGCQNSKFIFLFCFVWEEICSRPTHRAPFLPFKVGPRLALL